MTKVEYSTEITAPPERVHDFFLDQDNTVPGNVKVKKSYQGDPKIGDTFDLSGEVGGQQMNSKMKFIELEPNTRIVLEQVNGDFKSFRDTIVLERSTEGTRVMETWEYDPPYSLLGKILDAIKIRKDMQNYLTETHKNAKERLEKIDLREQHSTV